MEVISFHVDIISRGKGRSAIQMAAYCARNKLYSEYTGQTYDYKERHDLVYHSIMLPNHAPSIFHKQERLWNEVERIEKSKNARLARIVQFAMPKEFSHETQIEIARQFVQECFVQKGMCADLSIHDKKDGNPHVHVLLTTRSIDADGKWMHKQQKNYLLDKDGNKIPDTATGKYKLGKNLKMNDWDERERIEEWRVEWARICNCEFKKQGIPKQVTHLSYARQGIDREPTIHLGAKVKSLEVKGFLTDRGNQNRDIKNRNRIRERRVLRQAAELNREQDSERER